MNTVLQDIEDDNILNAISPNKDITVSIKDVINTLDMVSESYNIEDMYECSTAKFNTMLYNVGCRLIKPSRLYYILYNNKVRVDYNCIMSLANMYVYICYLYNKGISLRGFSNFLGLSMMHNTKDYDNLENCLTKVADFLKKADNELQLSNARDSKQAILQLAYNNFVHGWNGTIQSNTIKSSYKTLEDIKRERLESANDGQ